jgi:hypothetical protein
MPFSLTVGAAPRFENALGGGITGLVALGFASDKDMGVERGGFVP